MERWNRRKVEGVTSKLRQPNVRKRDIEKQINKKVDGQRNREWEGRGERLRTIAI